MQMDKSIRIKPSEITPDGVYLNRRQILAAGLATGATFVLPAVASSPTGAQLKFTRNNMPSVRESPNSYEDITTYNNYYEFGSGKSDPHDAQAWPALAEIAPPGVRDCDPGRVALLLAGEGRCA